MLYINFSAPIIPKTTEVLMRVLADEINKGEKEFCILFSSGGGSVNDGVTLHNYIKALPVKVIMYNMGMIDSIANVVFLAATERYAVKNSSFLYHGVGFDVPAQTRFEEKALKERLVGIERDQNLIAQIITSNTTLAIETVRAMFLETQTLTPEEAKAVGVIHDIKEAKIPAGAKVLSLVFG